jgi:hypothetical protein
MKPAIPRILLDTNVWRALADANAGQRLSSAVLGVDWQSLLRRP